MSPKKAEEGYFGLTNCFGVELPEKVTFDSPFNDLKDKELAKDALAEDSLKISELAPVLAGMKALAGDSLKISESAQIFS